ncbi:MAG: hypothetical protein M3071_16330, partial [Actinomycetota bacterium]|nr:hypothetical protein [Actinomycetota bacterium]
MLVRFAFYGTRQAVPRAIAVYNVSCDVVGLAIGGRPEPDLTFGPRESRQPGSRRADQGAALLRAQALTPPLPSAPSPRRERTEMAETATSETPTLFVCHGDDGGPKMHPCRRVQEALRASGIEYEKVIAAHGSPIPFLRKGSRDELQDATGAK